AALTGGEFYVIVEIVHSEVQVQKSLAASLQAEYNAFFSSAEISFSLSTDTKSKASQSQLRVIQYQASGVGVEVSIVTDVAGVMDRLKDFPRIAQAHPISVQVELAPYASIPGLQSNELAKFELREYLDDCARKRTTYKQVIDELDFLLAGQNRAYFESPPDDEEARQWRTAYTEAWGKVMAHATRLTEGGDITPYLEVAGLPTVRLKRRVQPAAGDQVAVPSLVGTQVDTARDMLSAVGLLPMPMPRTVSASDKTTARLTVLSQSPAAQALAAKGAQVQLDYAVNASRFARPFNDVMRSGALNVVKVLR
ncbi:PASTA domain-containing protein, partial [Lysobacter sp. 2RAB21]